MTNYLANACIPEHQKWRAKSQSIAEMLTGNIIWSWSYATNQIFVHFMTAISSYVFSYWVLMTNEEELGRKTCQSVTGWRMHKTTITPYFNLFLVNKTLFFRKSSMLKKICCCIFASNSLHLTIENFKTWVSKYKSCH